MGFSPIRARVGSYLYYKLLYGKLRERAVCGEFCDLIGYPSGQDGALSVQHLILSTLHSELANLMLNNATRFFDPLPKIVKQ